MKTALALALVFGSFAFAQERDRVAPPQPQDQDNEQQGEAQAGAKRRLESVTWNLKTHKLAWDVQSGSEVNGKFVPAKTDHYEISPDDAIMAVAEEKRGFTSDEAKSLHQLLDVLSLYCAESVVWWDEGQGVPLDKNGAPPAGAPKPDGGANPKRVEQPQSKPAPRQPNVAVLRVRQ